MIERIIVHALREVRKDGRVFITPVTYDPEKDEFTRYEADYSGDNSIDGTLASAKMYREWAEINDPENSIDVAATVRWLEGMAGLCQDIKDGTT